MAIKSFNARERIIKLNEINVGEIWFADLGKKEGSVQSGRRPVIVMFNHDYSPLIGIVPLTSKVKKKLPVHVDFFTYEGLKEDSTALVEQITTLHYSNFKFKITEVTPKKMKLLKKAYLIHSGIEIPPELL